MDKNKIKKHLSSRFISEETTPGISVTAKVQKDNAKINKTPIPKYKTVFGFIPTNVRRFFSFQNKIFLLFIT